MVCPQEVKELIQRFRDHSESYHSPHYNETQVRREFIDPFFKALGWDIDNTRGDAEAYKDVEHESMVRVGGFAKAPDYAFRYGGVKKFFVEAKKPSVNLKDNPEPCYQLRRYAWSAHLSLSVLTDFEEFAVYDCKVKPKQGDKPSVARVLYVPMDEYVDRWDEIVSVFSKDAIPMGGFDKFASEKTTKRGTSEVDKEFLKDIEQWRNDLAMNIALRNKDLSEREINHAVTKTIDRIIFMRICEDRGIEDQGKLLSVTNGANVYQRMLELFRYADDRYNSGLFHFKTEKDQHEAPDTITTNISIDDKVLKAIIKGLYYPLSPFEFSVLPADILGQVYEQFLGKVIRLTKGHQAKVEDKPEVKKAGGVYYTPTYIVDYIVKNTAGKLLEGKTPKQVEKLSVLDPACGSGSFLIGAYQYILDWHRDWYESHDPNKWSKGKNPAIHRTTTGEWRVTTQKRKEILLNNIYGVDIDAQAVEVTKLSLLLKVLEGETKDILNSQLTFLHERALPDLGNNIKCGNSLIRTDYFADKLISDPDEMARINPMDWETEFKDIVNSGGFDAIIGNPPYVRVHNIEYGVIDYLKNTLETAYKRIDISICFIEKGTKLLKKNGRLGIITSVQFFNAEYGQLIREYLAENGIKTIIDFSGANIFSGVTTYPGILIVEKNRVSQVDVFTDIPSILNQDLEKSLEGATRQIVSTEKLCDAIWSFAKPDIDNIVHRMDSGFKPLSFFGSSHTGLFTGLNEVMLLTRQDVEKLGIESAIVRPIVMGKDPKRYGVPRPSKFVIYPYHSINNHTEIIGEAEMKRSFPRCYEYLKANRDKLSARMDSRRLLSESRPWYALTRFSNLEVIESVKLFTPGEVKRNKFCLDETGFAFYCARVFAVTSSSLPLKYLIGLLNSKLLNMWLQAKCPLKQGGYFSYNANILKTIPIKGLNDNLPDERKEANRVVSLVDSILDLNKKLDSGLTPNQGEVIQRQIDATDRQIDQLVYELYGLTEEEIKIVEGKS